MVRLGIIIQYEAESDFKEFSSKTFFLLQQNSISASLSLTHVPHLPIHCFQEIANGLWILIMNNMDIVFMYMRFMFFTLVTKSSRTNFYAIKHGLKFCKVEV